MGVSPLPSLGLPTSPLPDVTHTHPDPSSDKGDVREAQHNGQVRLGVGDEERENLGRRAIALFAFLARKSGTIFYDFHSFGCGV